MRILFIHSGSDLYGASRSLVRLSSRLVKDANQVLAVLPGDGPLKSELIKHGVEVTIDSHLAVIDRICFQHISGKVIFAGKLVLSTCRLIKLINRFSPDLVHIMTAVIPSALIAARISRTPCVCHIRETFVEFPTLWKFYQRFILLFSDKILCVSTPVAEQFSRQRKGKNIQVLHNGFPKDEFQTVQEQRKEIFLKQFHIPQNKILIGVVGRIKFFRKGQEIFVKAAGMIKDKFPDAIFLCIGSPFPGNEEHLEQLLALVKKHDLSDQFIYTGDVADIKAAISCLDILVLPSVQPEPFGGVVIEGMALKKPVIATSTGGSIEQVLDQISGFLVEPGDPGALAAAMANLIVDKEKRITMGNNGYSRFLNYFEFEPFYEKMLDVYQNLSRSS